MENLIKTIQAAGSDSVENFGGTFNGGYHVQQNPEEFAYIIQVLTKFKVRGELLEIGSAAGGSARLLYELLDLSYVYIIDDNKHSKSVHRPDVLKNVRHAEFVGQSQSPEAAQWLKNKNVRANLVMIDADHSTEAVVNDTLLAAKFACDGAYFVYHDSLSCVGVAKAVNWLVAEGLLKRVMEMSLRQGITLCQLTSSEPSQPQAPSPARAE